MPTATVELRNIAGTQASMGWAGGHTVVVDRPEGRAGGLGLGFNGAQLLALALGGCFCNDLRYAAAELAIAEERLVRARNAARVEEFEAADRLISESLVNVQLATAKAEAARIRAELDRLNEPPAGGGRR